VTVSEAIWSLTVSSGDGSRGGRGDGTGSDGDVAVVAPAATVTLDGVLATVVLLLESVTAAPPDGAAALKVMFRWKNFHGDAGRFRVSEERVGRGGATGVTVSEAIWSLHCRFRSGNGVTQ